MTTTQVLPGTPAWWFAEQLLPRCQGRMIAPEIAIQELLLALKISANVAVTNP